MSTGLFESRPAQDCRGGVFDYVSPTRLSLWLKCPLAFKLQYVDGIRPPPTPSLFVGKTVHSVLECYYRHRQLGLSLTVAEVARRLVASWGPATDAEGMAFESAAEELASQRQAIGLVSAYLQFVPADEPAPLAVEVSAEAELVDPTNGENLGMPLVGIVDLMLPEGAGPLIVDFKTAAKSSAPLEIVHEVQLTSYAYLWRQRSPVPESSLEIRNLIKTKNPQVQFHHYDAREERHFKRFFSVLRAYLDDLHSGRFVFRPGWGCSSCDFCDTHCREWTG
jgi:hypothetical protein